MTGTLIKVFETRQVTEKLSVREFVIETDEQYKQTIIFTLMNQRTDLIDPYKIGDKIDVSFNVTGRSFNTKEGETRYNVTLVAWKIQRAVV